MKWLPLPFFLFLALLVWPKNEPKGFTLQKITSKYPRQEEWTTSLPPQEPLEPILSQPFSYMASGYQSYAFLSEDGNYVIKFFKQTHMALGFLERHFPFLSRFNQRRKRKYDKRRQVRRDTYLSCKIAFEELPKESQLVYIHLTKGRDLGKTITIWDNHGKKHAIRLDGMEFVVQRRGERCVDKLRKLFNECRVEEASALIEKLFLLVEDRNKRGIVDGDLLFEKNYGVIGGDPFLIDVGSLKRGQRDETGLLRYQIKGWLEKELEE